MARRDTPGLGRIKKADPLVIEAEASRYPLSSVVDYYAEELDAWQFSTDVGDEVGPLVLPLAPDRLHKANISGGPPYGLLLPDSTAEGTFVAEAPMPFVGYLNWVFSMAVSPAQSPTTQVHVFAGTWAVISWPCSHPSSPRRVRKKDREASSVVTRGLADSGGVSAGQRLDWIHRRTNANDHGIRRIDRALLRRLIQSLDQSPRPATIRTWSSRPNAVSVTLYSSARCSMPARSK